MTKPSTIKIDNVEYIRADSVKNSITPDAKNRKIIRGDRSGCFFGEITVRKGTEVQIKNARRLWAWSGAASLSELAQRGTSKPTQCKFPCHVESITILDAIEILDVSAEAAKSIDSVKIWSA